MPVYKPFHYKQSVHPVEPTEKIRNLFSKRGEAVRAETTFLMTDATTRDGDYIPVAQ